MVHLWLGMAIGLVAIVSFLPAAVFVWDEELTSWYYSDYVHVEPGAQQKQPLSVLIKNAQAAVGPGHLVQDVEIKNDPAKAYVFSTYKDVPEEDWGLTYFSQMEYWENIYVDPYSGKVLGVMDKTTDWIYLTRVLHQQLLLNYTIGHLIVGIATLLLFVMVITGLVLWWPRNKAAVKQRFSIKWNARWRRKNYDVHNVGGFYSFILILIFAASGLVWTFDWWTNGIYHLLGDDPKEVFPRHEQPVITGQKITSNPVDIAFADVLQRRPSWLNIYLNLPGAYGEGGREISAFVRYDENSGWDESDQYAYHPESGKRHHTQTHHQKTLGAKWRNSNYAIHVGSIYGLPTKILASFTALFCASLPVTGFLIWLGRRKKAKHGKVAGSKPHRQERLRKAFIREKTNA